MSISGHDFAWIQKLVLERAAISLASDQEYLVRSRLEPIARERGLNDVGALVAELRREPAGVLCSTVIEAMTTNETSFFRDSHPFETLSRVILPAVVEQRRKDRTITVWSAACSTGQEAYSLAMLLADAPALTGWRVRIVATDLSKRVLSKGQSASYTAMEVGRGLPARMLATHFERVGGNFRVKPNLRAMVEWREMNLAGAWPQLPMFDVVFMRNVLIYFPKGVVSNVLTKVRACISREGYLLLGSTENMLGVTTEFETVSAGRTIVYRPIGARK